MNVSFRRLLAIALCLDANLASKCGRPSPGECDPGQKFPSKCDCRQYFLCAQNGAVLKLQCQHGLVYDSATEACQYPQTVDLTQCLPIPRSCGAPEECEAGIFYRNTCDCGKFFRCDELGYPEEMDCPEGFVFDDKVGQCVEPPSNDERAFCPAHSECGRPDPFTDCQEIGQTFPSTCDCSRYFLCIPKGLATIECPGTRVYDVVSGICIPPQFATNAACPPAVDSCGKPEVCNEGEFYRNECDCTKYYECVNGVADVFDCPEGLVFDPLVTSCARPEEVEPDVCAGTDPYNCGRPRECKEFEIYVNTCDCSKYYRCSNGFPEVVPCGEGLVFDSQAQTCVVEDLPGVCPNRRCGRPLKCEEARYYANTCDCRKFFQCSNSVLVEMSCDSGLIFDPLAFVCTFPDPDSPPACHWEP